MSYASICLTFYRRFVSAAIGCALLAGCGDDSSSSTGGGSGKSGSGMAGSSGSAKGPNCNLISAADVSSMLGLPGLKAPTTTVNSIVTLCQYGDDKNSDRASIRYQTPTTASEFGLGKQGFADQGFSTSDVSDIGEMAYSSSLGSSAFTVNTLVFLYKTVEVEIVSPADFDKEKALGTAIIAKL